MLARKVKLQLNKKQEKELLAVGDLCSRAYNELLSLNFERLDRGEKTLSHFDMLNLRGSIMGGKEIGSHIWNRLAKRAEKVLKNWQESQGLKYKFFLQYGKDHKKPLDAYLQKSGKKLWGRPRFKTGPISVEFPVRLHHQQRVRVFGPQTSIRVPLVGVVKGRNDRQPLLGMVKQVSISRDKCKTWWASIICDGNKETESFPARSKAIGVDLGLKHTITAANEKEVIQPERERFLEKQMENIKNASRSRKRDLPFIHRKIARRRKYSHHVQAKQLVEAAEIIYVGNLNSKFLFSGKLARSASDAAHSQFKEILHFKAANAGRQVVIVNEAYTSMTCYSCGKRKKMELSERHFSCSCGYEKDRDVNAALNIMRVGECRRPDELSSKPK